MAESRVTVSIEGLEALTKFTEALAALAERVEQIEQAEHIVSDTERCWCGPTVDKVDPS